MSEPRPQLPRSLDEQRAEYARRRGLAMPLAGLIVWTMIGIAGAFLPPILAVWSLFIGAGCIAYLGIMLSRFTGENFLDKKKPKNVFDSLFFHCVAMALLVYAIAIPFFRVDYTSLPLTVGIPGGPDVGAVLLDHPALDRDLSRRSAHSSGDGLMVPSTASSLRGHSSCHRRRVCSHDCCPGAALASRDSERLRSVCMTANTDRTRKSRLFTDWRQPDPSRDFRQSSR